MKKLNKAQKIEKMLSAGATVAEVVEKLKVAKSYVYLVKQKMKPKELDITAVGADTAVGTELGGLVLTSPEKGKYRWVRKDALPTGAAHILHPDAIQDLQKARWYLERAIQRAE